MPFCSETFLHSIISASAGSAITGKSVSLMKEIKLRTVKEAVKQISEDIKVEEKEMRRRKEVCHVKTEFGRRVHVSRGQIPATRPYGSLEAVQRWLKVNLYLYVLGVYLKFR